jgi:hypothetical protein
MPDLPDPRPGDDLDATFFQAIVAWVRANAPKVAPGGGLRFQAVGGGQQLVAEKRPAFWARLTASGGGGSYSFKRQTDAAAGSFVDDNTMTGTATEVNGVATLAVGASTGLIVWVEQAGATSTWRFSKGTCP